MYKQPYMNSMIAKRDIEWKPEKNTESTRKLEDGFIPTW